MKYQDLFSLKKFKKKKKCRLLKILLGALRVKVGGCIGTAKRNS